MLLWVIASLAGVSGKVVEKDASARKEAVVKAKSVLKMRIFVLDGKKHEAENNFRQGAKVIIKIR